MKAIFLAAALIATAPAAIAPITITAPTDLSVPNPGSIRVSGLRAGERATLVAARKDTKGSSRATATFIGDGQGHIDTALQAPIDGSYRGIDPIGLYWSAQSHAAAVDDPPVGETLVSVSAGDRPAVAASSRHRPDPARLDVSRETPFPGAVYVRPKSAGRHPVIIVLGGSEGGNSTAEAFAPLFAAHGYATLGLPYYSPSYVQPAIDGLPTSFNEIPVDRLVAVRNWLAQQSDADIGRIGLWGVSKGSEFVLIAASRFSWIRAVVAVVPTDLVWEGWGRPGPKTASFAFNGKPFAFQPYDDIDREIAASVEGKPFNLARAHADGRTKFPDRVAAARIPIERYRGVLLVVAGGQDEVWPSAAMAANIAATRRRAGVPTEVLLFPGAGHSLAGPGTDVAAPLTSLGGDAADIAHGRAKAWRATFKLFDKALLVRARATNDKLRLRGGG